MKRISLITAVVAGAVAATAGAAFADGDLDKGAKAFRQCAACHTLQAGDHRTGPSLAGIWGKKAGSVAIFSRYSKALKDSGIVWNAETLDRWLADPKAMVPGNRMAFRGVAEKKTRDDLISFLKSASEGKGQAAAGAMGEMGGHGGEMPNLKELDANNRVTAITHCKDTFNVTTANGETHALWEFNLRFKVDSGANGPAPGKPVMAPSGMMGDRAFVVFASPDEISAFIKKGC
ncbi:MAG: c-type cytochrome [Rhodospirillales bacterium]|nr:c-type cytochrome [Rhodospirillales bacterium]